MTDTHNKAHTEGTNMTTTENTQPETVAPQTEESTLAKVQTIADKGMPATSRCNVCDAQAYVEVEIIDKGAAHLQYGLGALRPGTKPEKRRMEFCAHHYNINEEALAFQASRIIDHRPWLNQQERLYSGGVPV